MHWPTGSSEEVRDPGPGRILRSLLVCKEHAKIKTSLVTVDSIKVSIINKNRKGTIRRFDQIKLFKLLYVKTHMHTDILGMGLLLLVDILLP